MGEDTSFAYGVLAKRAAKDGRMKDAYQFLPKTREFIKKETTEAVFDGEMKNITLYATSEGRGYEFGVALPAPGARERVAGAGLSKEFQRYLRKRNTGSGVLFAKWMDESHAELEALVREARAAPGGEIKRK